MALDVWLRITDMMTEKACCYTMVTLSRRQQGFFYMHQSEERIVHATAFVTTDQSDNPSTLTIDLSLK